MPSFIRTQKDEEDWLRAKDIISRQYPKVKEGSESFWKLVNHVFHSISKREIKGGGKKLSEEILECIGKQ